MARAHESELEPTPGSQEGHGGLLIAIRHIPHALKEIEKSRGETATYAEYSKLLLDRPQKFSADEVLYRRATKNEGQCGECFHFFRQAGGNQRTVCEIYRPEPEDEGVNPKGTCQFFTSDGESYPQLGEDSVTKTKGEEGP